MTPLSPTGESTLAEPARLLEPASEGDTTIDRPAEPETSDRPMSRDPLERTDRYRLSVAFKRSERRSK